MKKEREGPCRDEVFSRYSGPCPNNAHVLEVTGNVKPVVICRCRR